MPQPKRDAVHRYYSYDGANNVSACNLCGNKMKGKHTSNLKHHIAAKHQKTYSKIVTLNLGYEASKTQKKVGSSVRDGTHTKSEEHVKMLKMLCMQLTVIHGRPLGLISDGAFRNILDLATSSETLTNQITEQSVLASIPETANQIKLKILSEIRNKLICLKVDSVTFKERKFVGVNIQYIQNGKIIVRSLANLEINHSQTHEFYKERLFDILKEFSIPVEQIYSLTMDNGSNMKKKIKLFEDNNCPDNLPDGESEDEDVSEDEEENEEPEGSAYSDLLFMQSVLTTGSHIIRATLCAARSLQLAIKDSIKENVQVQVTFDIARNITKILRNPPNKNLLKMADLKAPIIGNMKRWTTLYKMLIRLQILKDFCENIHDVTCLISPGFWDEIDQLVVCLKPFYECTNILQNEQLTIGDFYINWMNCKANISSYKHPLAFSLRQSMERREKSLLETDVALEALYLDGRLNVVLSQDQCEKAKTLLNQTREELTQANALDSDQNTDDQSVVVKFEPEPSTSDFTALEQMLIKSEIARGLRRQPASSFNVSLQELQCMSRLPLDTNIIEHWCNQLTNVKCSELAKVAHTVLATPVTQVSVERMFCSLKFMLSRVRWNLEPSLMQLMVFIKANKDLLE